MLDRAQLMLQMAPTGAQRWRDRKHSFRPLTETINTREYEVAAIDSDNVAKQFVKTHHYSGSYPAARFRFGLYKHGELEGVAVFSHPVNNRTITSVFPGNVLDGVELGRFVLLDQVPTNGETWLIARCFDLLRKQGIRGVVSFSDPVPRTTTSGEIIFRGHLGVIYQASNGVYLGRGTKRTLRLLPDGTVFNDRAIQKIRSKERGWVYAAGILEKYGAHPCPEDDHKIWLQHWLPKLTRKLPHSGNHRYAWNLARQKKFFSSLPYPKQIDAKPFFKVTA